MLYLVATPIGNMRDVSLRCIDTLQLCDYILCEDTRRTRILLRHHQIDKPLISYHQFNEAKKLERIVDALQQGTSYALVSDAGTPLISDPGYRLVSECLRRNIPVTSIPGPCALIVALTLSGFQTDRFQYLGFLPKKPGAKRAAIQDMLQYRGVSICYETAPRLVKTLEAIASHDATVIVCVARELTKLHEESRRGMVGDMLAHFRNRLPKGEIVLLLEPKAISR